MAPFFSTTYRDDITTSARANREDDTVMAVPRSVQLRSDSGRRSLSEAVVHQPTGEAKQHSHRTRLLAAMASLVAETGYGEVSVADVVRRAATSKSKFYENFADREACFVALLDENNRINVATIAAAVDSRAPWQDQVSAAVRTWFATAEDRLPLTMSWIRDLPALGPAARLLQVDAIDRFVDLVVLLGDTPELRRSGVGPVPRARAVMLIGGLRELTAHTVEKGEPLSSVTAEAVRSALSLLQPAH